MNTKGIYRLFLMAVTLMGLLFLYVQPGLAAKGQPRPLAASYRTWIAQEPSGNPLSGQSVRVWINSDTALGEMAGLEYKIGTTYTKILGTYDTSYAGANWRMDIPAQASGTLVEYQLFTRNEFGSDYGFTGFTWNYTVYGPNCDISWTQVLHDSFNSNYRSLIGPIATGATQVKLRLRVAQNDLSSARVRVWDDRTNVETYYSMAWDSIFDTDPTTYDYWYADIPLPSDPTILYYFFELNDNGNTVCPSGYSADQDFYADDDVKFYGGGYGAMYDTGSGSADTKSYQITLYDSSFTVPEWIQRGVVYQIFPDRFRDGNTSNDPASGRFFYSQSGGTVVRSNTSTWNTAICDPRGSSCPGAYSQNFYGGDLAGITEKVNAGYFDQLGVSVLYLNPIFRSPSNHKYDTADYLTIDPDFGSLADFQALAAATNAHNIKIILDGVFNHTSSDSMYFDRYKRYDASGNLTSPSGIGMDDNSGACEAGASSFYSWFFFPAGSNPGTDEGTTVYCPNGASDANQTYEAWYGYSSLPKLQANTSAVRNLIWNNGTNSVGPYWTDQGASGWRFDVGADVDPGLTNDPSNDYWEGFRSAVRAVNSSTLTLGEEWGDASAWLLGSEWDSVMNYRYRSAVLSWLFTGCSGDGCSGGTAFSDNDSNASSSSGDISYISPSQFNARLRSIQEDYPPMAWKAMMNLADSHDTNRLRFILKKTNNDNDTAAVQRMKELWLFAFTYAGAPTVYYGDEMGLSQDGVYSSGKYEDDPYNRAPFPWEDTTGDFTANTSLQDFVRKMSSIRNSYRALQDGDVQHGLVIDDANKVYGFARTNATQAAIILLNRDGASHSVTVSGLNDAPYNLADDTVLLDVIEGGTYTVSGGSITASVNPTWGVVLLEQAEIETPAAPASPSAQFNGSAVTLGWGMVSLDTGSGREVPTSYTVHRSSGASFTPDGTNLIATVNPPAYGIAQSRLTYVDSGASGTDYYAVCAVNASGKLSCVTLATQCAADSSMYRSSATGTWTDSTIWEVSTDGGTSWSAASCWPTSSNGSIQIQNGHTVTVAVAETVDQTTIDSGGQVTVNSGVTWTIADGASTDLTVNGTVVNAGTITMTGAGSFGAGSVYQHNQDGGVIPTEAWDSASTVLVTGVTATVPSGLGQTFGNLTWNNAGQVGSINLNGNLTTVNGYLAVTSTGSGSLIFTSTTALALTIGGDLTVSSGLLNSTNGSAAPTVNVGGDVILNGGTLDAGSSGVAAYNVAGNWTNNGGAFTARSGAVTFNSASAQTIGGSTSTAFNNIVMNKGTGQSSILEAAGPMSMTGNLTLSNGTFKLTHASASAKFNAAPTIPSTAGIWINGGTLNGGAFSTTNNGLIRVSAGVANFGISNGNRLQIDSAGVLTIEGGTTNIAGRLYNATGGSVTISNGVLKITTVSLSTGSNSTFEMVGGANLTMSGGTVEFQNANSGAGGDLRIVSGSGSKSITGGIFQFGNASTSAGQIFKINSAIPIFNLTINNASGVALDANATVNGLLTFTNGRISTGANTLILGSSGSVSGAGAGKYVYGNFQKPVAAGNTSLTFEVGGASNYAPAAVAFNGVSAGILTASTTDGQHPRYMDTDISDTDYINRYWTLTPSVGLTFTSYDATFTFVNPGDFVGSPNTSSLTLQKYSGSAWTNPVTTSSASTTVTGTGFTSFSDFMAGDGGVPLPVTLSYFVSTRSGEEVDIEWSTATASGNVGFNLYAVEGDQRILLNEELIPSQGVDSLSQLDYSYQGGTSAASFYLEEVDVNGGSNLHGPYQLGQSYGSRVEANKIDWASLHTAHAENQIARQDALSLEWTGRPQLLSLNLKVNQSGLYRVTYEMLRDAGLDLAGLPAANLLLTNHGKTIPLYVAGADPFGPGGYLEFNGQALDTIYTDTNVYTLQASPTPVASLLVEDMSFNRESAGRVSTYEETLVVGSQREYANYAPGKDAWYDTSMLAFTTAKSWEFPFQVDGLADTSVTTDLELSVWGITDWPQSPDHRLQVSVNGLQVSTDTFDGLVERTIQVKLPAGLLHEGANTLKLSLPADTGVDWDMINLDKFSVTYPRKLQARDGRLSFTAAGNSFTVTNLPCAEVVVYRQNGKKGISRLDQVRVRAERDGTFSATFDGSHQTAKYLVSTVEAMYVPQFEMPRAQADLNHPAEYLIISHPDFIDGLQPLIAAREAQGLTVKVVDVTDLYARYTYGVFDPQAIQQYIAYSVRELGAQYVLLVGGDTYDYRNYLGVNSISFIPSLYISTGSVAHFVPADPLYADVDGDHLPDVALGRFPVRSVAELNLMVSKTLAYQGKDYGQTAVFASDLNDGNISFKDINTTLTGQLPGGWSVDNIHLNDVSVDAARTQLIAGMNRGAALVTFTGHSGPQEWTFSNLFNIQDAAALTNHGKPFVVVQWGCWNNYYVDPIYNYLVQSFLFSGDQGAAAVMGASTLTDSTSETLLGKLLTPKLAQQGVPIGQALQLAKRELGQAHPELLDVLLGWSLMGDPALIIVP